MSVKTRIPAPLLWFAVMAFFSSFLFPGLRIMGVPVSPASLIALAFLPIASRSYDRPRWRTVAVATTILMGLFALNAVLFGFETRNALYLFIPLGAIGTVALVQSLAATYGMLTLQRWALWLCGVNITVMAMQAFNLADINEKLSFVWSTGIDFVASSDHEREILKLTLPIRPPGLFPTGIFASTVIYIVCRGIFLYQRKTWPLLFALFAILLSANRTLAVILVAYETISMCRLLGFRKFFTLASGFVFFSVLTVWGISQAGIDLYLLKFLNEELGDGVGSTASVVERLKTLEIFLENLPKHALTGGFSSSDLAGVEHVFDSEIMLRTLQFGIIGVVCLVLVILVPRKGERSDTWAFLFVLAFLASLTTTLTTSVVYAVALAFYKECVVNVDARTKIIRSTTNKRKQRRRSLWLTPTLT
ncbi:hypothetical protein [Limnohabitans sp. G3-2]|uniref:hypothetical protein n=1 Tax=Limnohabitans sp. G3-2 TaxID=1100711 RepID=UPI00117A5B17|nr:hypothetical protein [Limnohabitans sp. G3-2]